MSKDEFLKIQTYVLKVNIHCDGCQQKVKKILQKIDGVYTIKIDSEQGKVTVSGNVDPATLIKKLIKNGKHAEVWGAPKPHNHFQDQLNNQFKNLMIDNGKGGNNKGNIQKGGNKPKGGGQDPHKLLQQLQQMKGFQDLKPLPLNKDHNQKSAKLNLPEDEDLSDDEFDDNDYDDDDSEYDEDDGDEFDEDVEDAPLNKTKPVGGNGHGGSLLSNLLMNSQNLEKGGGNNGGNGDRGGKKSGDGENDGGANGGKRGGGNQNQGGGKGGGAQPKDSKNGGGGGGQNYKNDNLGGSGATNGKFFMLNGAKKSGGMNDETHGMSNMTSMKLPIGQMDNIPGHPIGSLPAVQGLMALNAPSGGGGHFHGEGPKQMSGNPYYQQQPATMMMSQRNANGNENVLPMIYARPPPAVNYMPSYLPYPYPPPPGEQIDQYSMLSDENTSGCTIM